MNYKIFSITLLLSALLVTTTGCSTKHHKAKEKKAPTSLLPQDAELRPGDVVFRRGEGLTSQVVLVADREGEYSHTGIVVDSCGTLLIVHAVPGEPDFEGDPDRVKADLPAHFFSSQLASLGEVCRPADSAIAARAAQVAWNAYQRHTLFDHNYDDADTTRFYCTELVAFAFKQAGVDLTEGRGHHINLPTMQQDCLFPSDIYESDFLKSIAHF